VARKNQTQPEVESVPGDITLNGRVYAGQYRWINPDATGGDLELDTAFRARPLNGAYVNRLVMAMGDNLSPELYFAKRDTDGDPMVAAILPGEDTPKLLAGFHGITAMRRARDAGDNLSTAKGIRAWSKGAYVLFVPMGAREAEWYGIRANVDRAANGEGYNESQKAEKVLDAMRLYPRWTNAEIKRQLAAFGFSEQHIGQLRKARDAGDRAAKVLGTGKDAPILRQSQLLELARITDGAVESAILTAIKATGHVPTVKALQDGRKALAEDDKRVKALKAGNTAPVLSAFGFPTINPDGTGTGGTVGDKPTARPAPGQLPALLAAVSDFLAEYNADTAPLGRYLVDNREDRITVTDTFNNVARIMGDVFGFLDSADTAAESVEREGEGEEEEETATA
jgi:hypothetical protein